VVAARFGWTQAIECVGSPILSRDQRKRAASILVVIFVLVFGGEVGGGSFGSLVAVAEAENLLDFFI
jgi:hypothetical protein